MSFNSLKVNELKSVAEYFAINIDDVKAKSAIIERIEDEGVTFEMYESFMNAEKEEVEVLRRKPEKKEPKGDVVLVKMERANPAYEINGYLFTREHPYVAMEEVDANFIFDTQEGFRMATPKEIQEYYN